MTHGFKSLEDFRIAIAAGQVCGGCYRHKDQHIPVNYCDGAQGQTEGTLLCPLPTFVEIPRPVTKDERLAVDVAARRWIDTDKEWP